MIALAAALTRYETFFIGALLALDIFLGGTFK